MTQTPPDWRETYRALRRRIDFGELAPGSPLPTIKGLAAETGLTEHGARKALSKLREEGRVMSWQGLGHQVADRKMPVRLDDRPWFQATMVRLGASAASELLATRRIRVPKQIAADMGLSHRRHVFQAEIVRLVDDRPMSLARNHFPADRFDGIFETLAETRSVTKALAVHGVENIHRSATRIEARMPTAHEALVLGIPGSQPVFVSTGVNKDDAGDVVEVTRSTFRADRTVFEV